MEAVFLTLRRERMRFCTPVAARLWSHGGWVCECEAGVLVLRKCLCDLMTTFGDLESL